MPKRPRSTGSAAGRATGITWLITALAACGEAEPGYRARPHGTLTFHEDIAPIILERCAPCHRPGGPAPFALLSYEDVRARAERIREVTSDRAMPPWLPEPSDFAFANDRSLTAEEVGRIRQWVDEGAREGDPWARSPVPGSSEVWPLGEPDLVVEMTAPYVLAPGGKDVFRNFVIPLSLSTAAYVRTVDLRPNNAKAVHHAVVFIDETESSRRADESQPGPGFDGMFSISEARSPEGFFLGWTPGKMPFGGHEDMSWRLEPGTDLVLQLHLRPTAQPETVRSSVALYFADQPPNRTPVLLKLGSQTIDIPPGVRDYVVRDAYRLPVDVELLSLYPHAHYLADEMEATATLPDGTTRSLLHIEGWDFNWQAEYRLVEPEPLPKGTVLEMEYTYDNSAGNPQNPNRPPKRVVYGPHTSDEMGDLWVQVVPVTPSQLATLRQSFSYKDLQAQVEGLTYRLRLDPSDAGTHNRLGTALQALGRTQEAIEHYQRALAIEEDFAAAHYNLGLAMLSTGREEEAVAHLREALHRDPEYARAHTRLGNALESLGRADQAVRHYREAVRIRPGDIRAHYHLADVLRDRGDLDGAIRHYREIVKLDPEFPEAHNNLANALRARGLTADAVGHYREALRLTPDFAEAHNNLANVLRSQGKVEDAIAHYLEAVRIRPDYATARRNLTIVVRAQAVRALRLATHPDPRSRRPAEAVRLAERAARLTEYGDPLVLDALAAVYAAADRFDQAVTVAEQALGLAARAGAQELARGIRERLELYRQEKPYLSDGPEPARP